MEYDDVSGAGEMGTCRVLVFVLSAVEFKLPSTDGDSLAQFLGENTARRTSPCLLFGGLVV